MAAQAGRGIPGEDRFWVCNTGPGGSWIRDYGADRVSEKFAFGGGAKNSVETVDDVGAVGICGVFAGHRFQRLCPNRAERLQHRDPTQDTNWRYRDPHAVANTVLIRFLGAAFRDGLVLRRSGFR